MLRNKIILIFFLVSNVALGQHSDRSFAYDSAQKLILNNSVSLKWDGDQIYYGWEMAGDKVFYQGDLKKKSAKSLFSLSDLKVAMAQKGFEGLSDWELYSYEVKPKDCEVHFRYRGSDLIYNWRKKGVRKAIAKKEARAKPKSHTRPPYWQKYNGDSTAYIYAKGHDLFLYNIVQKKEIKLSDDGVQNFSFNLSGGNAVDTTRNSSTSASWAGKYIVSFREDKRCIEDMFVVNSLSQPRPTLRTYKFPMPGDTASANYVVEIWDAETLGKRTVDVMTEKDQRLILPGQLVNGRTYLYAPRLGDHEAFVYFLRRNRRNDRVELCRLDFATTQVHVLIDETTRPHINEQLFAVHILKEKGDILFWSERTGFGQYYRYSDRGVLLNKVGPDGDYVVGGIHYLDTLSRDIYLEVYGFQDNTNPYYKQYLKSDLDSKYGKLLTPESYAHSISLSNDKRYFLDQYSDALTAPHYVVRDSSGRLLLSLGQADISGLKQLGWNAPDKVKLLAEDKKTQLYGLVYRPADFVADKKYPVIASVYPGPQDDFVPQSFSVDDNYHQSLSDLGFIVVQVPPRGSSPFRGLEFHSFSYGNMRDYPLADTKLAIEELAKDRPYMDLDRVGIFGHSGGGFMSATALMSYPDFFKVAVAASGNYDPNMYTQWWGETYHGLRSGDKRNYIPTTMELASRLKGKLLLITGDVDINVHPAQTFRLADALIRADKYFDMMVLPGKDHGLGDYYYQNLIRNYFLLHLKNKNDQKIQK